MSVGGKKPFQMRSFGLPEIRRHMSLPRRTMDSRGFTLVEMMLVVGLTGILGLLLSELLSIGFQSSINATTTLELDQFKAETLAMIQTGTNCMNMFTNFSRANSNSSMFANYTNSDPYPAVGQPGLPMTIYDLSGGATGPTSIVAPSLTRPYAHIYIKSVEFQTITHAPTAKQGLFSVFGTVTVRAQRATTSGSAIGTTDVANTFPMVFTVDENQAGNVVTSCRSISPGAGGPGPLPACTVTANEVHYLYYARAADGSAQWVCKGLCVTSPGVVAPCP